MSDSQPGTIGSTWTKCDLQIHTPASYDYKNKAITPRQIVEKIKQEKIQLAAITDHWSVELVDAIRILAVDEEITILPGFEFRIDKGDSPIHAVALFPEDIDISEIKENVLNQLPLCEKKGEGISRSALIKLGKSRLKEGKTDGEYFKEGLEHAYVDLREAYKIIKNNGGLIYLHYDKHKGLDSLNSVKGSQLKVNVHKEVDFFEISSAETKEKSLKHEDVLRLTGGQKAGVVTSDAHSLDEIGRKYCWIKARPTFSGLKQIIYEPEKRVWYGKNCPQYVHFRISKFSLSEQDSEAENKYCFSQLSEHVPFNPNLTAVIGPRGVGKSTLVELISFVYGKHTTTVIGGKEPSIIESLQQECPGINVVLSVKTGEDVYEIKKSLQEEVDGIEEANNKATAISVDYWSQGKVEKIARDKNEVSSLVYQKFEDANLKELWEEIEKTRKEIKNKRQDYLRIYQLSRQKDDIQKEAEEIDLLLKKFNSKEFIKLFNNFRELSQNKQKIDSFKESLSWLSGKLTVYKSELKEYFVVDTKDIAELIPSLKGKLNLLSDLVDRFDKTDEEIIQVLKKITNSKECKKLSKDLVKAGKNYRQYCASQGIDISEAEVKSIEKRRTKLISSLQKVGGQITQCKRNRGEHKESCKKLNRLFQKWEKSNQQNVDAFNQKFSSSEIRASYEIDMEKVINWVIEQFSKAYYAWKEQIEVRIVGLEKFQVEYFKNQLVAKYSSRDKLFKALKDCLKNEKLPKGEQSKFFNGIFCRKETASLRDEMSLRLQEFCVEGLNRIKYKNKPLESLSFGERCGTVLELILSSGRGPLIIDQPEDHIDTKFLIERLIPTIKDKKESRQMIICTRDPNLVVLADAELVIVLKDDDKDDVTENIICGAIEEEGIKEHICDVLEGGKEAFLKRERRYLLRNSDND
ncbi:MAG TPA: hypothetical protein VMW41_00530 [Candidatus Bathyarchaeia archaeon]|nr:hypothetical protein [Candidatus Bathyarchaeia archaeon]